VPVPDVIAYVRSALPPPPARVLEVGAGDGMLAATLSAAGYDVTAIDPNGEAPVVPVPLLDVDAPPRSFDAAVAVVSLHHVVPLAQSLRRLADVMRHGARLAVDELDVDVLDERAAAWWIERAEEQGIGRTNRRFRGSATPRDAQHGRERKARPPSPNSRSVNCRAIALAVGPTTHLVPACCCQQQAPVAPVAPRPVPAAAWNIRRAFSTRPADLYRSR